MEFNFLDKPQKSTIKVLAFIFIFLLESSAYAQLDQLRMGEDYYLNMGGGRSGFTAQSRMDSLIEDANKLLSDMNTIKRNIRLYYNQREMAINPHEFQEWQRNIDSLITDYLLTQNTYRRIVNGLRELPVDELGLSVGELNRSQIVPLQNDYNSVKNEVEHLLRIYGLYDSNDQQRANCPPADDEDPIARLPDELNFTICTDFFDAADENGLTYREHGSDFDSIKSFYEDLCRCHQVLEYENTLGGSAFLGSYGSLESSLRYRSVENQFRREAQDRARQNLSQHFRNRLSIVTEAYEGFHPEHFLPFLGIYFGDNFAASCRESKSYTSPCFQTGADEFFDNLFEDFLDSEDSRDVAWGGAIRSLFEDERDERSSFERDNSSLYASSLGLFQGISDLNNTVGGFFSRLGFSTTFVPSSQELSDDQSSVARRLASILIHEVIVNDQDPSFVDQQSEVANRLREEGRYEQDIQQEMQRIFRDQFRRFNQMSQQELMSIFKENDLVSSGDLGAVNPAVALQAISLSNNYLTQPGSLRRVMEQFDQDEPDPDPEKDLQRISNLINNDYNTSRNLKQEFKSLCSNSLNIMKHSCNYQDFTSLDLLSPDTFGGVDNKYRHICQFLPDPEAPIPPPPSEDVPVDVSDEEDRGKGRGVVVPPSSDKGITIEDPGTEFFDIGDIGMDREKSPPIPPIRPPQNPRYDKEIENVHTDNDELNDVLVGEKEFHSEAEDAVTGGIEAKAPVNDSFMGPAQLPAPPVISDRSLDQGDVRGSDISRGQRLEREAEESLRRLEQEREDLIESHSQGLGNDRSSPEIDERLSALDDEIRYLTSSLEELQSINRNLEEKLAQENAEDEDDPAEVEGTGVRGGIEERVSPAERIRLPDHASPSSTRQLSGVSSPASRTQPAQAPRVNPQPSDTADSGTSAATGDPVDRTLGVTEETATFHGVSGETRSFLSALSGESDGRASGISGQDSTGVVRVSIDDGVIRASSGDILTLREDVDLDDLPVDVDGNFLLLQEDFADYFESTPDNDQLLDIAEAPSSDVASYLDIFEFNLGLIKRNERARASSDDLARIIDQARFEND